MLKKIDDILMKTLDKVKFLALIKPIMATKIKCLKRKPIRSSTHEFFIQDRNDEQSNNIVNYDVNNTIQIKSHLHTTIKRNKITILF